MKKLSILFILLFPIIANAQSDKKTGDSDSEDWKTVKEKSFTINYPATWNLDQSGQMGTSLMLFSPVESEQDKFRENVNVIIQDLKGMDIDLDKYTKISEDQVKNLITNSKIVESNRIKNGNSEYHKIIYTGEQGLFKLTFEQYYLIKKDKAYILTFTSEQDKYEDFKETGEEILNSFQLKK